MTRQEQFAAFAALLKAAGLDPDAELLADALWLGAFEKASIPQRLPDDDTVASDTDDQAGVRTRKPGSGQPVDGSGSNNKAAEPATTAGKDPSDRKLYAGVGDSQQSSRRASPFYVPAASALPGSLDIARGLRPFNRKVDSTWRKALDEEATADSFAEFGFVRPVLRPIPERWFDVALVVDAARSMDVWLRTIQEFEQLLARHGAFAHVRRWRLLTGQERTDGSVDDGICLEAAGGQRASPAALIDSRGRTVVLIATNGVGQFWNEDGIAHVLAAWSSRAPVAILQLFSERQWAHTALGKPSRVVRAPQPGSAGALLEIQRKAWERTSRDASPVAVPLMSLAPESIFQWARSAMAMGLEGSPAVVFTPGSPSDDDDLAPASQPQTAKLDARARVRWFASSASAEGFELACYLAAVPLTLPIMRIVQQEMSKDPRVEHLAEVIASGLLIRLTPADAAVDPDMVVYDYPDDVRDVLLSALGMGSALDVRAKVQSRLKEFIERQLGRSIQNFRAFVLDDGGVYQLPDAARAFVEIERGLLVKFGVASREPPTRVLSTGDSAILGMSFAPDGRRLAALCRDGNVRQWDLETGATQEFPTDGEGLSIAWSPRGDTIAIGSSANVVLHAPDGGRATETLTNTGAERVVFSPDGRFLACAGHTVTVWELGRKLRAGEYRPPTFWSVLAWSPDGRSLAVAGSQDEIVLLDPSMRGGRTINSESIGVGSLAFSPDGRLLAIARRGESIGMVQVESGSLVNTLAGHTATPHTLVFVDAATLLSASPGSIRLWDVESGDEIHRIPAPGLTHLAFHTGSKVIAAAYDTNRIQLIPLPDLARRAPLLTGRAKNPRRLYMVTGSSPQAKALAPAIRTALTGAGHTLVDSRDESLDAVLLLSSAEEDARRANSISDEFAIETIALRISDDRSAGVDFRHREQWQSGFDELLTHLDRMQLPGPLIGVPPLPRDYFRRAEILQSLLLWARSAEPVLSVVGPPGSGRKAVATELARTPEIRRIFRGGVYWMPDALPDARQPSLVVTDRRDLVDARHPWIRFLLPGIRTSPDTQYVLRDLNDKEQQQFLGPITLPTALRVAALRRIELLARWRSILLHFADAQIARILRRKRIPREYGAGAIRFVAACAIELLDPRNREELRRYALLGELPSGALTALGGSLEALANALQIAQDLNLAEPGSRTLHPDAVEVLRALPGANETLEQIAEYYRGLRRQAGDAGWGGVPEDGYFLSHIASILTSVRAFRDRSELLNDESWIARRRAAHGDEALLADAALAGLREEIERRLHEQPRWDFFVSYSHADEGVQQFIEEIADYGNQRRRYFMRAASREVAYRLEGEAADAIRHAPALLVVLSASYLSSPQTSRELQVFLERQRRAGFTGRVIAFVWGPVAIRDLPENLRNIQIIGLERGTSGPRTPGDVFLIRDLVLDRVVEALDHILAQPALPPLSSDFDVNTPVFSTAQPADNAWLATTAETEGYENLLGNLRTRPDIRELYWTLLTCIRSGEESWPEFFARVRGREASPPPTGLPDFWHQAMAHVASSLNDRFHAPADALPKIRELADQSPGLVTLLNHNPGNSIVSRVAMYYAFLLRPSLQDALLIADQVRPDSEEVRFGRALLPWMRCMSWISAHLASAELIEQVRMKIDAVQMAIPGRMTSKGEFREACEYEVNQHIRPWLALAALANDYVDTRAQMPSGPERTTAMTTLVEKMQPLTRALELPDLAPLLSEQHPGRRLIAYAALAEQPNVMLQADVVNALAGDEKPFAQYWALRALLAMIRLGSTLDDSQRSILEKLRLQLPPSADRAGLLQEILAVRRPQTGILAGRKIVWVDDHPENNTRLIEQFEAAGATVRTETSSSAFFASEAAKSYDLVISDIARRKDPEAGLKMVRVMRQQGFRMPVVFYAGYLDEKRMSAARDLGVPLFNKPRELRDAVMKWRFE